MASILMARYISININKKDKSGRTPLFYACLNGNEAVVKYLVEHGADVNKINKWDITPLHNACIRGDETIVKYLVEHGAM